MAVSVEVKTITGGSDYRATLTDDTDGVVTSCRLRLDVDGIVWVFTRTRCVGGYQLSRFGGSLTPDSIRGFLQAKQD